MEDVWDDVQQLWARARSALFPDCRGDEIDGVDLVMLDADLAGCVMHFLGKRFRDDVFQLDILRRVNGDLDRILPKMSGDAAVYFDLERRLARATLLALGEDAT